MTIPDPRDRPTLTVEEAGRIVGIGRSAAFAAAERGELPTIRFGRRLVVPTAALCSLLGIDPDPIRDDAPPVEGEASVISLNSGGTRRGHQSTA